MKKKEEKAWGNGKKNMRGIEKNTKKNMWDFPMHFRVLLIICYYFLFVSV